MSHLGTIHLAWQDVFNFEDYGQLLPLVTNSLYAGLALGLVGGLIGVFVIARDQPFAVHGISELSFAGASGALLLGGSVITGSFAGSLIAAALIGLLGARARERNSIIGVLMPFGLGLGILFLSLYQGRAANKFGLLTGQIVAIDNSSLTTLLVTTVLVLAALSIVWRPLMFASVDPEMARARGVPVGFLNGAFMLLLGCTVAISVQVVGALLVLALLCTPAAAAIKVTTSPIWMPVLSVAIAIVSMVGGTLLALGTSIPISPYVTSLSFLLYLACRLTSRAQTQTTRRSPSLRGSAGTTVVS